jgi:hypothetical protein
MSEMASKKYQYLLQQGYDKGCKETTNNYESIIIPNRERKLIEEIDTHYCEECEVTVIDGKECMYEILGKHCHWWQQLKQKRGI